MVWGARGVPRFVASKQGWHQLWFGLAGRMRQFEHLSPTPPRWAASKQGWHQLWFGFAVCAWQSEQTFRSCGPVPTCLLVVMPPPLPVQSEHTVPHLAQLEQHPGHSCHPGGPFLLAIFSLQVMNGLYAGQVTSGGGVPRFHGTPVDRTRKTSGASPPLLGNATTSYCGPVFLFNVPPLFLSQSAPLSPHFQKALVNANLFSSSQRDKGNW